MENFVPFVDIGDEGIAAKLEPVSLLGFHEGCGFLSSFHNDFVELCVWYLFIVVGGSKEEGVIMLCGEGISNNFPPISGTPDQSMGGGLFKRCEDKIKLDGSMVAFHSSKYRAAIMDTTMKPFAACKDV